MKNTDFPFAKCAASAINLWSFIFDKKLYLCKYLLIVVLEVVVKDISLEAIISRTA